VQEVSRLKEKVKNLRIETNRLRKGTNDEERDEVRLDKRDSSGDRQVSGSRQVLGKQQCPA
jgi:hypothetical protein